MTRMDCNLYASGRVLKDILCYALAWKGRAKNEKNLTEDSGRGKLASVTSGSVVIILVYAYPWGYAKTS
jgi:hypothetical protein